MQRYRRERRNPAVGLIGLSDTSVAVEHALSPLELWEGIG
jgi:hypothetical protein